MRNQASAPDATPPSTIDQYINASPPPVRSVLRRIRRTIRTAAPEASELISYRMPAFKLHGILVYFAAFKNHIGLYPPVAGDPKLVKAAAPYAGEKGNLRFPLDRPIPYDLIRDIVLHRRKQNLAKHAAKGAKPKRLSGATPETQKRPRLPAPAPVIPKRPSRATPPGPAPSARTRKPQTRSLPTTTLNPSPPAIPRRRPIWRRCARA